MLKIHLRNIFSNTTESVYKMLFNFQNQLHLLTQKCILVMTNMEGPKWRVYTEALINRGAIANQEEGSRTTRMINSMSQITGIANLEVKGLEERQEEVPWL